MKEENTNGSLKQRIRCGKINREDVIRRLAELAFGKVNDCVKLALEEDCQLSELDLSLLGEVKRSEKGMVEIKLIDRLKVLQQLAEMMGSPNTGAEEFLRSLSSGEQP